MAAIETGRPLSVVDRPAAPPRLPPLPMLVPAAMVAAAALLPAAFLIVRAFETGLGEAGRIIADSRTVTLVGRTLALTAAVTATAVAIGVPVAWLTARTDLPGRRIWSVLTALPLVIPSYVAGYVMIVAFGPRGSIVQGWLSHIGVQRLPSIYGFTGAWLTLSLFTYPYVLLTARAALRGLDPSLEEASRSLGHNARQTFRRVIVPQLRPAVFAGALLVSLYALHDFGAVSLLHYRAFTVEIYTNLTAFAPTRAAVLSLVLVALAIVVLAAEARSRGRASYYRSHAGAARLAPLVRLGAWRWPALAACGFLVAVTLALPLGVVSYWLARSVRGGGAMSITAIAAMHSVVVSAIAAGIAVAAAWPVARLAARFPGKLARGIEGGAYVGYAVPGIVVALALVFFGIRYVPFMYQTLAMLIFAYLVLFLPQAVGAERASILQISPQLEDAARALGSGRLRTLWKVVLPLAQPGIAAAAALVFLTAMKELPATLLLAPSGFDTLATRIWNTTSIAFFDRAAPPALALILLSSVPLAFLVSREARERS